MKPYTLTIRFRETDEYEAEVGAFMMDLSKHTDKSKNKFVIDLIAEYMKRSERERRENAFIERLRKMIREELEAFAFTVPDSAQKAEITSFISEMTEDEEAANAASVLNDLEMFC
jgi:uncharacterized protein YjgD (DUF1641 family)